MLRYTFHGFNASPQMCRFSNGIKTNDRILCSIDWFLFAQLMGFVVKRSNQNQFLTHLNVIDFLSDIQIVYTHSSITNNIHKKKAKKKIKPQLIILVMLIGFFFFAGKLKLRLLDQWSIHVCLSGLFSRSSTGDFALFAGCFHNVEHRLQNRSNNK